MNIAFIKKPFFMQTSQKTQIHNLEGIANSPISPDSLNTQIQIQDPNQKRELMMRGAELSRK